MKSEVSLIMGGNGQDGQLLRDYLVKSGERVACVGRSVIELFHFGENEREARIRPADLRDFMEEIRPTKIFFLAANHASSDTGIMSRSSSEDFNFFFRGNLDPYLDLLCAVEDVNKEIRVFYASSALVYERNPSEVVNEESPFFPASYYSMAKAQGIWVGQRLREDRGFRISSGILFNHESHLRRRGFLSAKVIRGAIDISRGKSSSISIAHLDSPVDWGYAPDFVRAFDMILSASRFEDFLVATGVQRSIKDFLGIVFDFFDLDWQEFVRVEKADGYRPRSLPRADISKITGSLAWQPSMPFEETVRALVADHLEHY